MADPKEGGPNSYQAKTIEEILNSLSGKKSEIVKAIDEITNKISGSSGLNKSLQNTVALLEKGVFKKVGTEMTAFGMSTGISAAKFNVYSASIQLAIAATIAFLDIMDKLEIKQASLQRLYGASSVTVGQYYHNIAQGARIAGSTGEKAADQITQMLLEQRKGVYGGTDSDTRDRLINYTAGVMENTPEIAKSLMTNFGVQSAREAANQIERFGTVAMAARLPVAQYTDMIMSLADQFAYVGVKVPQAERAVSSLADLLKNRVNAQALTAFTSQMIGEQTTSAGVPQRFMTSMLAGRFFDSIPEETQNKLNKLAGGSFKDANLLTRADILASPDLTGVDYANITIAKQAGLKQFSHGHTTIEQAISPGVAGLEAGNVNSIMDAYKSLSDEDARAKFLGTLPSESKEFQAAVDQFDETTRTITDLQKEFFSNLKALFTDAFGSMVDAIEKLKADSSPWHPPYNRNYYGPTTPEEMGKSSAPPPPVVGTYLNLPQPTSPRETGISVPGGKITADILLKFFPDSSAKQVKPGSINATKK